ncbi:MAG: GNAT family N-acetyltransferase [Actinomycetota bacterium]|nr:GNAT family N-acetyltransferase [Actinomycetota bacterium]
MIEIDAEATHDLRWRLLREGMPGSDVSFAGDHHPGALHLALANDDGVLAAVASFSPLPSPHHPGARAVQLRGLAVEPRFQQAGLGRLLLDAGIERLRGQGFELVWANGRDTVLGFYRRLGWRVLGEGFLTATGIPHHLVVLEI